MTTDFTSLCDEYISMSLSRNYNMTCLVYAQTYFIPNILKSDDCNTFSDFQQSNLGVFGVYINNTQQESDLFIIFAYLL